MNNISIIYQKELKRVFSDKKLVFSLFFLPLIMVVAIYGLMSFLIKNVSDDQNAHQPVVAVYGMPESLKEYAGDSVLKDYEINSLQTDSELLVAKQDVLNETVDLVIVFNDDFDEKISTYQVGDTVPDVHTYYNPSSDYSNNAREEMVYKVLEEYRQFLLARRFGDVEAIEIFSIDKDNEESMIQDEDKAMGEMLGSFIPYIITILLFAGGMGIGVDMFAGEKERGTMAALLITPMPRTAIVLGKMLAMMTFSALSALVYVISMMIAIPFVMKPAIESEAMESAMESSEVASAMGMSLSFEPWQVWMLMLIIISMLFVYVAVIVLTAIFAKDTKEASTYISPVYMVVMMCGMVTMFTGDKAGTGTYLIPFYGAVIAIKNVLGRDISMLNCWLCVLVHLIVGGILVFVVAKAFDSERVMFDA